MDRVYYRMCSDAGLIVAAKENPNSELAIALGERLEDVIAETDNRVYEAKARANDFEIDADRLDDKVYELRCEIQSLELMVGVRDDEIAHLREQIAKLTKEG